MTTTRLKIAVIGGGVAGLTSAYILDRQHEVSIFEKNSYVGGHTNTVVIQSGPDAGTAVDTGFIVFNDRTYPNFNLLLSQLGVSARDSEMSFSYYNEKSGLQYSGASLNGLFAQRIHLLRPSFYRMVQDMFRFNQRAVHDLERGLVENLSLGQYLANIRLSVECKEHYLLPMGAAIWSANLKDMLDFPAETFIRFFKNHGLLSLKNRPQWKTVLGGSFSYVNAILEQFKGTVHLNSDIAYITREPLGPVIHMRDGSEQPFDRIVLASHADESLKLLEDPSPDEFRYLGVWKYSQNHTVLHTDPTVLPPLRRAWAAWNYTKETNAKASHPVSLSYSMNILQGLQTKQQYSVTLNRTKPIAKNAVIQEFMYTHPTYSAESIASQPHLPSLNGIRNTYFCGSYFGYGFHEDAVNSALAVAGRLGMSL